MPRPSTEGSVRKPEQPPEELHARIGPWEARLFLTLMETVPDAIYFKDDAFRYRRVNRAMAEAWGLAPADFEGRTLAEIVGPERAAPFALQDQQVAESLEPAFDLVEHTVPGDRTHQWISVAKHPVLAPDGRFAGIVGISRNITKRVAAERENALLRALHECVASAPDYESAITGVLARMAAAIDCVCAEAWAPSGDRQPLRRWASWAEPESPAGDFLLASEHVEFAFGSGLPGRVAGQQRSEWIDDLDERGGNHFWRLELARRAGIRSAFGVPVLVGGAVSAVLTFFRRRPQDGSAAETEALLESAATVVGPLLQRKQAEIALKDSERRFRHLFHDAPVGIVSVDGDGRILEANPKFHSMLGYSGAALRGESIFELVYPEDRDESRRTLEVLAAKAVGPIQHLKRYVHRNGRIVWADVLEGIREQTADGAFATVSLIEDITERRVLEEEIRQAQRTDSVGRLVGSIAHDFNNILHGIGGYSALAAEEAEPDSQLAADLEQVGTLVRSGSRLARQLLTFCRPDAYREELVDLNRLCPESLHTLRRVIPKNIELEFDAADEEAIVRANPGSLEQVLWNLVINARDAMPDGGDLVVRTRHERTDAEGRLDPPGAWVILEVEDSGIGMDAAEQERIFDRFYTTKSKDQGTGLGLTTVSDIVAAMEGRINLESEVGRGTRFTLRFPAYESDGEPAAPVADASVALPAHTGSILLLDDDRIIRELMARWLRAEQFTVRCVDHPERALAQLAEAPALDLLITDLDLPGAPAGEVIERARERHPGIGVLVISGRDRDAVDATLDGELGDVDFLQKPFTLPQLIRAVSAAVRS